ncbi:type II toxin-antitoxin system RelE/ParE family toxin [Bradyrhizobium sp. SZCCHNS3003]
MVEYAASARRDLEGIAAYYRIASGAEVAKLASEHLRHVIDLIAKNPRIGRVVAGRPQVRAFVVPNYPYKLFYRERDNATEILRIYHTSRRPF